MLRKEGGRQRVKTRWRSQAMAEGAGALVVGVGPFRAAVLEPPSSSRRPRAAVPEPPTPSSSSYCRTPLSSTSWRQSRCLATCTGSCQTCLRFSGNRHCCPLARLPPLPPYLARRQHLLPRLSNPDEQALRLAQSSDRGHSLCELPLHWRLCGPRLLLTRGGAPPAHLQGHGEA